MKSNALLRLGVAAIVFLISASPTWADHFGACQPRYFPALSLGKVDKELEEISGAAVSRVSADRIWVHNDGIIEAIHAIGKDGAIVASVIIGIETQDVEDIAIGSSFQDDDVHLYLGDIGSNDGSRSTVSIIRAREPEPHMGELSEVTVFEFFFPDGSRDAETLLFDPVDGELFIGTKEADRTRLYSANLRGSFTSPAPLEFVAEVDLPSASGGDISSDGSLIALRNETEAKIWSRLPGEAVAEAIASRPGVPVPVVGPPVEPNGESFAFEPGSAAYLTLSEGKKEHLFHFRPSPSPFESGEAIGEVELDDLKEISGCAASQLSPDVLWVHNDGEIDSIFAIDVHGKLIASVSLGRTLADPEDIATAWFEGDDRPYIYVGDIGDNDAGRTSVGVLRFPEPPVHHGGAPLMLAAEDTEWMSFRYPGGAVDAETLMVDPRSQSLVVATKEESGTRLFGAPAVNGGQVSTLSLLGDVPFASASGGDISADGGTIALRRENYAAMWWRPDDVSLGEALLVPGLEVPIMSPPQEPNGEGFAFSISGAGYYTVGEERDAPIFFFATTPASVLLRFDGVPTAVSGGIIWPVKGYASLTATVERSTDLRRWITAGEVFIGSDGSGSARLPVTSSRGYLRLAIGQPYAPSRLLRTALQPDR